MERKFKCVNPYNKTTATVKERSSSCIQDENGNYLNKQLCVENCFINSPQSGKKENTNSTKKPKSTRKSSTKSSRKPTSKRKKEFAPCKEHQYRDPVTNRCRNKKDAKSKRRKSTKKPTSRRKKEFAPCKEHQYRDPLTNRCRNKEDVKKSKKREPSKREEKPRWVRVKKSTKDCIKRSKLPLRDLQIKVVQYMDNHDGLLVVHGTGAGKTLTAITVSQCYLDKNPKSKVVFVGPASLTSNFRKELKNYGLDDDKQYEFYSFDKFYNQDKVGKPVNLKNKMLIVDEAHNLRNPKSLKSRAVQKAAFKADKRLLLTATPFVNNLQDFVPLINMIYGRKILGTQTEFNNNECDEYLSKEVSDENLTTLGYLLRDKLDFNMDKDSKDYPLREDHIVNVNSTPEYYERYKKLIEGADNSFDIIFSNPGQFYNAHRRAVNKAGAKYYSMKIRHILPKLKQGKCIVYTNWIEFGIGPITTALKEENISYRVFYGDTPINQRQEIVNDYNDNKFQVLILTKAGGEGLDLKGTKNVVILDPTWNDSGLEQIIGRAIRYHSHQHLPLSQRKVNVFFMVLKQPEKISSTDTVTMGDVILYEIIKKKNEINSAITAIIKEMSI